MRKKKSTISEFILDTKTTNEALRYYTCCM